MGEHHLRKKRCAGCWAPLLQAHFCNAPQLCSTCSNLDHTLDCQRFPVHATSASGDVKELPQSPVQLEEEPKGSEWIVSEPKRPPAAYFLFAAQRSKCLSQSPVRTANNVSIEWQHMTKKEREPWMKQAICLKATYDSQVDQYRDLGRYQSRPDLLPESPAHEQEKSLA